MSTETNNSEQSPVLIVVAGATTVRARCHSSIENLVMPGVIAFEHLCAYATRRFYSKLGSLASDMELVIPPHLGFWPFESSYKSISTVIRHKSEKYPDRQKVLIGHSLGGSIAVRFVHEHPEVGIKSTVTIGAPFSRLGLPMFGVDRAQLGQNTNKIHELREDLAHEAPKVVHLASDNDFVVPPDSALPEFAGAGRILFSDRETPWVSAETRLVAKVPDHWRIVGHPATLAACQETIMESAAA